MNSFGNSSFLDKEIGPANVKQIVAATIAIVIGIAFMWVEDVGSSVLVWLIIAIILYMLPHLTGAKPQLKCATGVVFIVLALILGAFVISPGYIEDKSKTSFSESGDYFHQVEYSGTDDTISVTAYFDDSKSEYSADYVPAVVYCKVDKIEFRATQVETTVNKMTWDEMTSVTGAGTDNACATGSITIDNSKLYFIFIAMVNIDGTDHDVDTDTKSATTLSGFDFTGEKTDYTLAGCGYAVGFTAVIFFLIFGLTFAMRRKISSTRDKMEAAGRLYPQGYGRCTFCGALVLPGQVNCSKCGAYIDRPESMKPHKKDCFRCSNCGAEISESMTECPKCGVKFDGEENVVTHEDGTVDISEQTIVCPVCGKHIPANAQRCTYCGKKFDE